MVVVVDVAFVVGWGDQVCVVDVVVVVLDVEV